MFFSWCVLSYYQNKYIFALNLVKDNCIVAEIENYTHNLDIHSVKLELADVKTEWLGYTGDVYPGEVVSCYYMKDYPDNIVLKVKHLEKYYSNYYHFIVWWGPATVVWLIYFWYLERGAR